MSKSCPKCGGSMERGYVPETKDQSTTIGTWIEGEPKKTFVGLDTRGLRQFETQTWRCGSCAYLESYAPQ